MQSFQTNVRVVGTQQGAGHLELVFGGVGGGGWRSGQVEFNKKYGRLAD